MGDMSLFEHYLFQQHNQTKRDGILGGYSDWSPHTPTSNPVCSSQNPKWQDLAKILFLGGGRGVGWEEWERGSVPNPRTGHSCQFGEKILEA